MTVFTLIKRLGISSINFCGVGKCRECPSSYSRVNSSRRQAAAVVLGPTPDWGQSHSCCLPPPLTSASLPRLFPCSLKPLLPTFSYHPCCFSPSSPCPAMFPHGFALLWQALSSLQPGEWRLAPAWPCSSHISFMLLLQGRVGSRLSTSRLQQGQNLPCTANGREEEGQMW